MMFDYRKKAKALVDSLLGRIISSILLRDSDIFIAFEDGSSLKVWDDGQSCCETRYITSDESFEHYSGSKFLGLEMREFTYPEDHQEDEYMCHECEILFIKTSVGDVDFVTHNEHNGYYGGFMIDCEGSVAEPEDDCL